VTLNSLIPANDYLFFEIFSLLICVGNCAKSRCGTAVYCFEIVSSGPEIAEFPVKFPVSREFAWRPVRSPLRRQPGIPRFSVAIATGKVYADCGLAVITPMASNPKVTESGFTTIFRLTNRDDRKGRVWRTT
jgi:hypothetical protein